MCGIRRVAKLAGNAQSLPIIGRGGCKWESHSTSIYLSSVEACIIEVRELKWTTSHLLASFTKTSIRLPAFVTALVYYDETFAREIDTEKTSVRLGESYVLFMIPKCSAGFILGACQYDLFGALVL